VIWGKIAPRGKMQIKPVNLGLFRADVGYHRCLWISGV